MTNETQQFFHDDDEEENEEIQDKWSDYLVGFRSGKPSHMVIAGILYAGILITLIAGSGSILSRIFNAFSAIGVIYLFSVIFQPPIHTKRSFYAFLGIFLIVFGTVCNKFLGSDDLGSYSQTTAVVDNTAYTDTEGLIDYATFEKIRNGMTYNQVKKMIGSEGKLLSSYGEGEYNTFSMTWDGVGSIGANAVIMFQNNKVISKSQFGLE